MIHIILKSSYLIAGLIILALSLVILYYSIESGVKYYVSTMEDGRDNYKQLVYAIILFSTQPIILTLGLLFIHLSIIL